MRIEPRAYYISDLAYKHLVHTAQKAGFVDYGVQKAKGLSDFINSIANIPMEDTRPASTKERHNKEISFAHAPTWLYIMNRRARLLKLHDDTIVRLMLVALQVGIIRDQPWPVGGPDRRTPYPTVSLVLEGIGLKWITPIELPTR